MEIVSITCGFKPDDIPIFEYSRDLFFENDFIKIEYDDRLVYATHKAWKYNTAIDFGQPGSKVRMKWLDSENSYPYIIKGDTIYFSGISVNKKGLTNKKT